MNDKILECVLCLRYCPEYMMMCLMLATKPMKHVLLSYPFYGARNRGTERLRNLLEVMELWSSKTRIGVQAVEPYRAWSFVPCTIILPFPLDKPQGWGLNECKNPMPPTERTPEIISSFQKVLPTLRSINPPEICTWWARKASKISFVRSVCSNNRISFKKERLCWWINWTPLVFPPPAWFLHQSQSLRCSDELLERRLTGSCLSNLSISCRA